MKLSYLLKHLGVVAVFAVFSLVFFYPTLQSKVLFQSDIVQYIGMSKQQKDFKNKTGTETYWTNSAFGGMPTYQLGATYPHNYIKTLDLSLRFLPRPADYLFLYLLCFYILMMSLKVDYRMAVFGALAFGLSTYLIVILGAGHNAKAHAIAYLPLLLSGIIWVFRGRYLLGAPVAALGMGLEIVSNHIQMTYYFMLFVLLFGLVFMYRAIRDKELKDFFNKVGILVVAVTIGILMNATSLLATKQYSDWSTRGPSELTIQPDGSPKVETSGLSKEYITEYSYGIFESLNLFVPRLLGGSGSESIGTDSKLYDYLLKRNVPISAAKDFVEQVPLYWGSQPIVSGPAYLGAVVVFLFVLSLVFYKGPYKYPILGGILLSLVLSWGKNFGFLTDLMISYFPWYSKFRAVSSIQIVLELLVPVLAVLGLKSFLEHPSMAYKKELLKRLLLGFLVVSTGLYIVSLTSSFTGLNDSYYRYNYGDDFMANLLLDRKAAMQSDILRSFAIVLLTVGILYAQTLNKLKTHQLLAGLSILLLFDLGSVAKNYVSGDDFVPAIQMNKPYSPSTVNKQIANDEGYYRVYNYNEGLVGAKTSYFHNSIGGYHGAKPRAMQDVYDFHLSKGHYEPLHLLNVKYVIQNDDKGNEQLVVNEKAIGAAWFVADLIVEKSLDSILLKLDKIDGSTQALILDKDWENSQNKEYLYSRQSHIELVEHQPNYLRYKTSQKATGFAVFSEMYYAEGWQAYVDGNPVNHYKVDYLLRGLELEPGDHIVEFMFEPKVIATGSRISIAGSIGMLLLVGFSVFKSQQKR